MTRHCEVVLDSYRLAQYVRPIPCYICETDNTFDAEYCRHCFAPMALAHQANVQKIRPGMVAILGASNVGKTVYLGMLMDMLSRRIGSLQVLARGAFSITLQQATMAALANGSFPEKTPNEPDRWNWIHCQVSGARRRQRAELIMPDIAGEALLEEVDHPRSYPVIRSFISKCSAAMLLVDAIKLEDGRQEQEHFAMKALSFLTEVGGEGRRGWGKRPVAVVFTKADQCDDCLDRPETFARQHAVGMWNHANDRFSSLRFFASGVAGACAYRHPFGEARQRIPLRVEPHGVIEPFEWLVRNLPKTK